MMWRLRPATSVTPGDILFFENDPWLVDDVDHFPSDMPLVPLVIRIRREHGLTHNIPLYKPDTELSVVAW